MRMNIPISNLAVKNVITVETILQKEIVSIAEKYGVSMSVVDKDWVLGHFISTMFSELDTINLQSLS